MIATEATRSSYYDKLMRALAFEQVGTVRQPGLAAADSCWDCESTPPPSHMRTTWDYTPPTPYL